MNILDQIEQRIVHSEVRSLTQGFVDSGDISADDQETLVNAAWVIVTLALTLYGRAAAQGNS
jgi:hypothetical protein